MPVRPLRTVLPVTCVILACAIAGCSSSKGKSGGSSAPGSSTPASGAASTPGGGSSVASGGATDLTSALITPSDIPVAGVTEGGTQSVASGRGIAAVFTTPDGRQVGDTIIVLPNAAAAKAGLNAAVAAAPSQIQGATTRNVNVGDGGKYFAGTTSSGAKSSVVVVFTEGTAFVTLQFDGNAGDPAPDSVVQQVATAQDDKLKANPPS